MTFTGITAKRISSYVLVERNDLDGCAGKESGKKEQIFPMLMKNNCPVFNFKDCCFQVQKDREGAARVHTSFDYR